MARCSDEEWGDGEECKVTLLDVETWLHEALLLADAALEHIETAGARPQAVLDTRQAVRWLNGAEMGVHRQRQEQIDCDVEASLARQRDVANYWGV